MTINLLLIGIFMSKTLLAQFNEGSNKITKEDPYRPQFHFTADSGFLSDPNGLVYYNGEYHLFHQYNPFDIKSGVPQHWGHAVSSDLVNWYRLPIAVYPHEGGNIWSGSAVVDINNTSGLQRGLNPPIIAFYTYQKDFTQRLIYSNDGGYSWTEYEKNPVIDHLFKNNRDPKVFWHNPTRKWIMVLYTKEFEIFISDNLRHWEHASYMHLEDLHECPDLFELPVDSDNNNRKWVVIDAKGSYYVGSFDGVNFTPESGPFLSDWNGSNRIFYATQTFNNIPDEDGRRIQIACMRDRNNKIPSKEFRNQMTFPCELSLQTTDEGIKLFRKPVKEIEKLYSNINKWYSEKLGSEVSLRISNSDLLDIHTLIKPNNARKVSFVIRGINIEYDVINQEIICEAICAPLKLNPDGMIELRILVDMISFEIFGNGGLISISVFVNPALDETSSFISAEGGSIILEKIYVAEIKPSIQ